MCFPSKWLKKNFSDEDRPDAPGPTPTKAEEKPAKAAEKPATASKPAINGTTASTKEGLKTLKTAIIIYTMYGHIASREPKRSPYDPSANLLTIISCSLSRQLPNRSKPA